jgi:hypothetical protein
MTEKREAASITPIELKNSMGRSGGALLSKSLSLPTLKAACLYSLDCREGSFSETGLPLTNVLGNSAANFSVL